VIRKILASSVLGAVLLLAGASGPAQTAPLPALSPSATKASPTQKVVWVCGPAQCLWDPTPDVGYVAPDYATAWVAPLYPSCYWKRGIFGRWKMICP
jgi:hypothetical protein